MKSGSPIDLSDVAKLYTESLIKHGTTAKGVGWTDKNKHKLRLDALSRAIPRDNGPITVNDGVVTALF